MSTSCSSARSATVSPASAAVSYGRAARAARPPRELDAYPRAADRFLAELDEEDYLHFAGHKPTRPRADLRAARRPDDARDGRGARCRPRRARGRASSGASRGRATSASATRGRGGADAAREAELDGRADGRSSRSGCCGPPPRTSPTGPSGGGWSRSAPAPGRAPDPGRARAADASTRPRRARRADLRRALPPLRLRPRGPRRPVPGAARRRPSASTRAHRQAPRARVGVGLGEAECHDLRGC